MIYVWVDELTPCLKDAVTGDLIPTEVTQIVRKSFLTKYRQDNGWYHFVMGPEQSSRLIGEYDYEWTNAKI